MSPSTTAPALASSRATSSTIAFLQAAVAYHARFGIRRVLTDNSRCCYSERLAACRI
jgi:hypothetical protein